MDPVSTMWRRQEEDVVTTQYRLTVYGPPRTKKTSNQTILVGRNHRLWVMGCAQLPDKAIVRRVLGRVKVMPSAAYRKWVKTARIVYHDPWPTIDARADLFLPLPDRPYNVCAIIYRERRIGDAVGYMQGLADFLAARGVIRDDKWIVTWDGTCMAGEPGAPPMDRQHPRIEVTLTALDASA